MKECAKQIISDGSDKNAKEVTLTGFQSSERAWQGLNVIPDHTQS